MQRLHEIKDDLHPVLEGFAHSMLGKVVEKAKWLLKLDCALQAILPTEFASHCYVMNVDRGILILGVDSAAISTRVQFMALNLIFTLQQNNEFRGIQSMRCKVCVRAVRFYAADSSAA